MRRAVLVALLLTAVLSSSAQCGSPCQPVTWPLPTWPALMSPTPFVPDESGAVPTATGAAPTATPANTATPLLDAGDVGASLATLEHIVAGTVPPLANPSGTPFTIPDMLATAQADTEPFWSYSKGIAESNFLGPFAPFAGMLLVALTTLILLKGSTFILPIAAALFGVVRRAVSLILDFLPF